MLKMKNTDTLNLDMSIEFFEDLVVLLKELKKLREKEKEKEKEIKI